MFRDIWIWLFWEIWFAEGFMSWSQAKHDFSLEDNGEKNWFEFNKYGRPKHEVRTISLHRVSMWSFFPVYPSILFVFCPFRYPFTHSQWVAPNACSALLHTQKEGKSHERKCYNQSMSHRKSIKCLHHSLIIAARAALLPILIGCLRMCSYIMLRVTMSYVFITIYRKEPALLSLAQQMETRKFSNLRCQKQWSFFLSQCFEWNFC